MEANNKQRGFMKCKLAKPFSRVTKRSPQAQGGSKVMPSPSSGSVADQKYANHSSMQKVMSYAKPDNLRDPCGFGGDENVDTKAASYISYVRERFKLDRVDSDAGIYQEVLY